MERKQISLGHHLCGGLFSLIVHCIVLFAVCLAVQNLRAQTAGSDKTSHDSPGLETRARLTPSEISEIRAKADAGDVNAELKLGRAYRDGNGVAQNDQFAAEWYRRAADHGDAGAQNELANSYRFGEGVSQNKEEAVRWYAMAAKNGNPIAMFNLGTCYYNGDGVPSNEFTAYAWFLLAQEAGDKVADDAVRRSGDSMSPREKSETYIEIAGWYGQGNVLPLDDTRSLRWLRMAASLTPQAKVHLANHLVNEPQPAQYYGEALDLCKAAARENYPAGDYCVGVMYRKGWGVMQDSAEALKWYEKALAFNNPSALVESAEMYTAGEGTKVDRTEAFMRLLRATQIGVQGARQKASEVLALIDKSELKRTEGKLRGQRLDPKKVFAAFKAP